MSSPARRSTSIASAFAPINADFLADRQVRNLGRLRRVDRQMEQATMDENRVEGTARNLGGKAQEGFSKVTGNARAQAEGLANQAAGAAQDLMDRRQTPRVRRQAA